MFFVGAGSSFFTTGFCKTNCYPGSSLKWIVTLRTTRSQSLGSCMGIALKQVQRTKKTHDKLQSCNAWGNVTLLDLLATRAWNLGELLSCWFSSERVRMAKTNAFFSIPIDILAAAAF